MPKLRTKFREVFFPEYELRREIGINSNHGWRERLKCSLYSSLRPCTSWDPTNGCTSSVYHGGIFNLEFSPDGKQLVAACENKAILIFDPLSRKLIHDVPNAHSTCVNVIKFLDNRLFASCSDDKTVALWDVRNIKKRISKLSGHSHWVKNIEYSSEDGMLVTSGFDGRILGWDINKYAEGNTPRSTELFSMKGLMRTRLTPDLSKLVICTTAGYMVVVHDLDLKNLANDLEDFKPSMYRLMQISNVALEHPSKSSRFFSSRRNRVEFISDFPVGNDAEIIHSLQVHPQGWCVLSRNTSTADSSEWTCVHDIQDLTQEETDNEVTTCEENINNNTNSSGSSSNNGSANETPNSNENDSSERDVRLALSITPRLEVRLRRMENMVESEVATDNQSEPMHQEYDVHLRFSSADDFEHIELRRLRSSRRNISDAERDDADVEPDQADAGPSSSTGRSSDFMIRRRRGSIGVSPVQERLNDTPYPRVFLVRRGLASSTIVVPLSSDYSRRHYEPKIPGNLPRLTNYIEEPNKGKGFIKELCFSPDGRLICSPYDCGIRLLAFDEKCSELSHCVQKTPQTLHVVSQLFTHTNGVVSTKFSPNDCLLVSGCLSGRLVWYQPVL